MSSVCAQSRLGGQPGGGRGGSLEGTAGVWGEGLGGAPAGRRAGLTRVSWLPSTRSACGLAFRGPAPGFREVTPIFPDLPLVATPRLRERSLISLCSVHIF